MTEARRFGLGTAAALLAGLLSQRAAANLIDWHVDPGSTTLNAGQYANWLPYGGTNPNNSSAAVRGTTNGIAWTVWDGYGPHGNSATGTHKNAWDYGGQEYDVKAMYVRNDLKNMYVGVVTGFNPAGLMDSPSNPVWYHVGDLAINYDWSHNTAGLGVVLPTASAGSSGSAAVMRGGTWYTPNACWPTPPLSNYKTGGTSAGSASYSYTDLGVRYYDAATGTYKDMFLLEASVPMELTSFSVGSNVDVAWGMTCNNDFMDVDFTVVPEPSAMALIGVMGVMGVRRRRA